MKVANVSKNHRSSSNTTSQTSSAALHHCSIAIIVSDYNSAITRSMEKAAVETLVDAGITREKIRQYTVPGAWELCLATKWVLERTTVHGVIALGCVIRGETTHDQHINRAVSNSLMELSLKFSKPVGFGLLTVENLSQAEARAGGHVGNKGHEAASAVLSMLQLSESM